MVIEVEVRGPLSKDQHQSLLLFLKQHGKYLGRKERQMLCCMDLETLKNDNGNGLDIRSKITNGKAELSIKKGKWGGSDFREEISVNLAEGEYLNLVKSLQLLGYDRVIWVERHSERYILTQEESEFEFALVEVPEHSVFFEIELLVAEETNILAAKKRLEELCKGLNLHIFSDEEWFAHVDMMDREANKIILLNNPNDMAFVREELELHMSKHLNFK